MDPKILKILLTMGLLMVERGIPAGINLIRGWDVTDPTDEEIDNLHALVDDPANYLGPEEEDR